MMSSEMFNFITHNFDHEGVDTEQLINLGWPYYIHKSGG